MCLLHCITQAENSPAFSSKALLCRRCARTSRVFSYRIEDAVQVQVIQTCEGDYVETSRWSNDGPFYNLTSPVFTVEGGRGKQRSQYVKRGLINATHVLVWHIYATERDWKIAEKRLAKRKTGCEKYAEAFFGDVSECNNVILMQS